MKNDLTNGWLALPLAPTAGAEQITDLGHRKAAECDECPKEQGSRLHLSINKVQPSKCRERTGMDLCCGLHGKLYNFFSSENISLLLLCMCSVR